MYEAICFKCGRSVVQRNKSTLKQSCASSNGKHTWSGSRGSDRFRARVSSQIAEAYVDGYGSNDEGEYVYVMTNGESANKAVFEVAEHEGLTPKEAVPADNDRVLLRFQN